MRNCLRLRVRVLWHRTIKRTVVVMIARNHQFKAFLDDWLNVCDCKIAGVTAENALGAVDTFLGRLVLASDSVIDMPESLANPKSDLLSFRAEFAVIAAEVTAHMAGARVVVAEKAVPVAARVGSKGTVLPTLKFPYKMLADGVHTDIVCDGPNCKSNIVFDAMMRINYGKGPKQTTGLVCNVCMGVLRDKGILKCKSGYTKKAYSRNVAARAVDTGGADIEELLDGQ